MCACGGLSPIAVPPESTAMFRRNIFPTHREIVRMRETAASAQPQCCSDSEQSPVVRPLPRRESRIPMRQSTESVCDLIRLVQSEYLEMPGLHLSKRQAQRMWSLDALSTDLIFSTLEAANFLKRMSDDVYIRADLGC
jgi:hypothetical protein